MSKPLEGGPSTTISTDGVTVERQLDRRGDGIVVTLDLTSDVRGPIEVDLVDEFPSDLPVERVGFNVDHEPDEGTVSLERVELHHAIEGGGARIVYAIRLDEPADDVAFEPPTIRDVTLPGLPESRLPADDESADDESVDDESVDEDDDAPQAEGADGGDDVSGSPDGDSAGGSGFPDGLSLGGADDDATGGEETAIGDGGADSSAIENAIESAIESDESSDAGPSDAGPSDTGSSDAGSSDAGSNGADLPEDAAGRRAQSGASSDPSPTRGEPPGGDEPTVDDVPRSVRLRLDRLNARVEEFAAYAEALEGIIERHGTAPEILEDIETDLAEADERLADVRGELESLESRHAADLDDVGDRVDSLEATLEDARRDLESEVDDVRDDLDAVDGVRADVDDVASEVEALDRRVDDYESDVDELGATVQQVATEVSAVSRNVEAMRSEMEALQGDVDRLLRFREILADVFGGPVRRATESGADPFDVSAEAAGGGTDSSDHDRPGDGGRGDDGPSTPPTESSR